VVGSPTKNGQPTKTDVNTLAVYALDTVNWNDKILVNIGTRIDRYAITRQPYNSTQASRDDVLLNGNIGLTYKLLPSASLYAAFGTSSNPVGAEMDGNSADYGAITTGNQTLRPERNTSAEAGTKWELFDRRALLTAAVFQTTKDHARETIGSGASAVIQDTAAYRIRGLEFTASGKLTDEWSLFGGISFLNSQVEDSATASNIGRPLANIAHASFNLLTKYQLTKDLSIGTQATYKGEILGGTTAATWYSASTVNVSGSSVATPAGYNKLPSGWRFDLMAEYQISKVISAKFIATNIFDKVLYDAFYRSNTPFVYLSPGRSAQLTLQAKF
jgi:catecholate siderophore receptor